MSGPKQAMNERIARQKATQQRVFISGLKGTHTLETGVAYHYRGHFIYAYPAGNPIEPVPFSTKKGINIVGIAKDRAPEYDSQNPNLEYESTVLALEKSCFHEQELQREQEERRKLETQKVLKEEEKEEAEQGTGLESESGVEPEKTIKSVCEMAGVADSTAQADAQHLVQSQPPSRVPSLSSFLVPPQVALRFGSRNASHVSLDQLFVPGHQTSVSASKNMPRIGTVEAPWGSHRIPGMDPNDSWTPHDRGQYLAYSAPGSRQGSVNNTPWRSRSGSPNGGFGVPGQEQGHGYSQLLCNRDTTIRPVASTSHLYQLLADQGTRPSFPRGPEAVVMTSSSHMHPGTWQDDKNMVASLSVAQECIDPSAMTTPCVETVSRRPSLPLSLPMTRSHSPSALATTPDEELEGRRLYLPGLGHPGIRRTFQKTTCMYRPTSANSPAGYTCPESEANLNGVREQSTGRGCCTSRASSSTTASGNQFPLAMLEHGYGQIAVEAEHPCRPHSPAQAEYPSRRASEQINSSSLPSAQQPPQDPSPAPLYISLSRTGRPRAASRALNQAYNAANPSGAASTLGPVFPFSTPDFGAAITFTSATQPLDHSCSCSSTEASTSKSTNNNDNNDNSTSTLRCSLHADVCDGSFVTEEHLTLREWSRSGLEVQQLPTIEGTGGRVLIDWVALRDEEIERMKG